MSKLLNYLKTLSISDIIKNNKKLLIILPIIGFISIVYFFRRTIANKISTWSPSSASAEKKAKSVLEDLESKFIKYKQTLTESQKSSMFVREEKKLGEEIAGLDEKLAHAIESAKKLFSRANKISNLEIVELGNLISILSESSRAYKTIFTEFYPENYTSFDFKKEEEIIDQLKTEQKLLKKGENPENFRKIFLKTLTILNILKRGQMFYYIVEQDNNSINSKKSTISAEAEQKNLGHQGREPNPSKKTVDSTSKQEKKTDAVEQDFSQKLASLGRQFVTSAGNKINNFLLTLQGTKEKTNPAPEQNPVLDKWEKLVDSSKKIERLYEKINTSDNKVIEATKLFLEMYKNRHADIHADSKMTKLNNLISILNELSKDYEDLMIELHPKNSDLNKIKEELKSLKTEQDLLEKARNSENFDELFLATMETISGILTNLPEIRESLESKLKTIAKEFKEKATQINQAATDFDFYHNQSGRTRGL